MTYHDYLRRYRARMQNMPIDVNLEQAYWRIGWLRLEQIEELATQMMEEGYDNPALVKIAAGLADSNSVSILFERALTGLGQQLVSEEEAAKLISCHIATDILIGSLSPADGASLLIQVGQSLQRFPDWLCGFYQWEDEIECNGGATDEIRTGIVEDAKKLMQALPS